MGVAAAVLLCGRRRRGDGSEAQGLPAKIKVLSNRADLVSAATRWSPSSRRRAPTPRGDPRPSERPDVTGEFAVRENGRFEALLGGLRLGANRLRATVRGRPRRRRQADDHQPPERRPGLLRPAGAAVGLPGDRRRRPVQPAGRLRATPTSRRAGRASSRTTPTTRPPTSRRRPPTRARRCPSSSAPRPATRTATSTGSRSSTTRRSRPRPGLRRPGWNHKLLITHGASCGIDHQAGDAPSVTGDTVGVPGAARHSSPTAALGRGFAVMSTALDNAGHNCNLLTQAESLVMAKERLVEQYGPIRYTIGTGCSGGSLTQQQVANAYPGHLPGDPAAVQLPRRVEHRPAARRLPPDPPLPREPGAVGARASSGRPTADRGGRGAPQPRQLDHPRHPLLDVARRPDQPLRGRHRRAALRPGDQPRRRPLHARRLHDQRPRAPRARASGGRRSRQIGRGFAGLPLDNVGRAVRPRGAARRDDHPGAVRRPQRQGRRRDDRLDPDRAALRRPTSRRLRNAYRSGGDQQRQQPGRGRDHRPARARPRRLPRRLPQLGDPRAARARARHLRQPGDLVRPGAADRRPAATRPRACWRWTAGWRPSRRTTATVPLAQKIIDDRPADIQDRCAQVDGVDAVEVPGIGPRLRARRGADQVRNPADGRRRVDRHRHQQVRAEAARPQRLLPDRRSPTPSGRSSSRRSRPASATTPGRASTRATRSAG